MKRNPLSQSILFYAPDKESGGGDAFAEQDHEKSGSEEKQTLVNEKPGYQERKANFMDKFSAKNRAPVGDGGKVDSASNVESAKAAADDNQKNAELVEQRKQDSLKVKEEALKPKPFIKQQIEAKRTAEQERDELRQKAETLQKSLSDKETEMESLRSKIDSGDYSSKKEAEMERKLADLEGRATQERETLSKENERLRSRVEFYDLSESPEFQKQFIKPVKDSFLGAKQIIGNDKAKNDAFQQALVANGAALRAESAEERISAENQRDGILSQIVDGMNQFTAGRFTDFVNQYITASFNHAQALSQHESTTQSIRKQRSDQQQKAYVERLDSWGKQFEATGSIYDEEAALTEEEKKIAAELKIDVDTDLSLTKSLAKKVVIGESEMPDAMKLIHMGRVLPAYKAKVQVLEHRLKSRDALIAKLRAGGSGDSSSSTETPNKEHKKTREEWQRENFSAGRARA